tara:strand:+ start:158281 stop:158718 length:438 start_codon:yes stop_codon:yes gene_type:complete
MYTGILHLHSFLPYLFLSLLLISVLVFWIKRTGKKDFGKSDKQLALFTLILAHTQATVGLVVYFLSPIIKAAFENSSELMSDKTYRFYAVEHALVMLIAVVLITMGYSKSKKKEGNAKFNSLSIFYTLGLILILSRLPWEAWLGI